MNHGRWIVHCPFCSGAELAEAEFFCLSCFNSAIDNQRIPVEWPAEQREIEAALSRRSAPNRNWHPGEKVEDLMRENDLHHAELRS